MANYVLPHEVLNFVSCDFCNGLDLYPLGEILDGNHEVLHLLYC